jgi:hypothetical protein
MSEEREPFLERWSRLKTKERAEAKESPEPPAPAAAPAKSEEAAPLPQIDQLTPESDFRPFMSANVDPSTRRDALKKLFADPQFNVPDPFEAYSGDWTGGEPIPPEMLKTLNQAKKLLFDEPGKEVASAADEATEPQVAEAKDGAGSKDA